MKKLQKQQKGPVLSKSKGFTIIEVLIVLAIAGLIMLIVFLAVPALQRNSRNTQYKNQVSSYLGAVNEWMNNNNGQVPVLATDVTAINDLSADGPIAEPTGVPLTGAQALPVAIGTMQLVTEARCDGANIGDTEGGSARTIAIRYSIEDSAGDPVGQCTGS